MWLRLVSLAVGTFAVGTDSFVIAPILGRLGRDLDVSPSVAGQLITGFALTYALLAPVLATTTGRWPRRRVLLVALAVFAAGNVVTALATGYWTAFGGRMLAGVGAAMYTPTAMAVASVLGGEARRGRALSVVGSGLTSATVLGVPLGAWLGGVAGWRSTLWLVIGLAGIAAVAVALAVPAIPGQAPIGLAARLAPLRQRRVLTTLAVTVLALTAFFTVYTYIDTALLPATGGDAGRLALATLLFGVGSVIGNQLAGHVADRYGPRIVVTVSLPLAVALMTAIPLLGTTMPRALTVLALSGAVGWLINVPQQLRLIAAAPPAAPLLLGLHQSGIQAGIAASGVTGALGLALGGQPGLGYVALGVGLVALVALAVSFRFESRPAATSVEPQPVEAAAG